MIDRTLRMSRLGAGVLLLASILVSACAADDDGGDGDDGDDGAEVETFTCFATIGPVSLDYVVSGDLLELSGGGITQTWERVEGGDPARLVYGTWHVGEETTPGVGVASLDFVVEPDQVRMLVDCDFGSVSGSAEAISAAEITDTTITILEADEDVQVITQ